MASQYPARRQEKAPVRAEAASWKNDAACKTEGGKHNGAGGVGSSARKRARQDAPGIQRETATVIIVTPRELCSAEDLRDLSFGKDSVFHNGTVGPRSENRLPQVWLPRLHSHRRELCWLRRGRSTYRRGARPGGLFGTYCTWTMQAHVRTPRHDGHCPAWPGKTSRACYARSPCGGCRVAHLLLPLLIHVLVSSCARSMEKDKEKEMETLPHCGEAIASCRRRYPALGSPAGARPPSWAFASRATGHALGCRHLTNERLAVRDRLF